MKPISFKRDRLPPDVICYGVWLYVWFTLSVHHVEKLLAQRHRGQSGGDPLLNHNVSPADRRQPATASDVTVLSCVDI